MLLYQQTKITFAEVPDEISLCIEIAGCPIHCPGCHSPWLWKDEGQELTIDKVKELVKQNPGITCVCFMGGDQTEVEVLAKWTRQPGIKIAWYTGLTEDRVHIDLRYFDYVKFGPYVAEKGPINKPTTNQRLYRIDYNDMGMVRMEDITSKFWHSSVETGQDEYPETETMPDVAILEDGN